MKKNKKDILTLMAREYEIASQESEDAVTMVTTAMNRLKVANQKMKSNMDDIEAYCANMMTVHAQLGKNCSRNEAVISNFSKLLCIEED
jgi:flagellar biosynthesis chaperone FliJ